MTAYDHFIVAFVECVIVMIISILSLFAKLNKKESMGGGGGGEKR